MQIGLFAPSGTPSTTPSLLRALGPAAEARGFASLWVPEHVVMFDAQSLRDADPAAGFGLLDPFATLAFLAALTTTIRLGTGVALVSQRQPLFTAKEVVTVDHLSGGRIDFGVGVGWVRQEFEALGLRREDRGNLADRNLEIMRTLWVDPVSEFQSTDYALEPCRAYPKPLQQPHPPVHVGGHSDAALRRVVRYGQGWYAFGLHPGEFDERMRALERFLDESGRERRDIVVSVCGGRHPVALDEVRRYREAGADQVILMEARLSEESVIARLDQLAPWVAAAAEM